MSDGPLSVATPRARLDRRPAELPVEADIGLFDRRSWSTGWKRNESAVDTGVNRAKASNEIAEAIRAKLAKRGYNVPFSPLEPGRIWFRGGPLDFLNTGLDGTDKDSRAFWRALADAKARFPDDFAEYAGVDNEDGLLARAGQVLNQRQAQANATSERLTGGGKVAAFLGEIGASWDDTETLVGLLAAPIGGVGTTGAARTLLSGVGRTALIEGAIGGGSSLVVEPLVRNEAAARGVQRDLGDTARDVGMSAVAGGVLGGGLKVGENGLSLFAQRYLGAQPPAARPRIEAAGSAEDRGVAAAFRASVPEENMTAEERAALAVLDRMGDLAEANPVPAGPASAARNVERAAAATIEAATGSRPRIPDPAPASTTDIAGYLQRTRSAESSGNDVAQAGLSSAFGRYQFTKGTWLSYYKRRFGAQGLSDQAILAKRADGALQDRLMMDLTQDNARALRRGGHVPTNDNLYVMHFAGPADGLKILDAPPGTPVSQLMRAASLRANPTVADMTAGQLRAWAARKMRVPGAGGAAVEIADDAGDALAGTLARLDGEEAQLLQSLADLDIVRAREALDGEGDAALVLGGGGELDDVVEVAGKMPMRMGTRLASEIETDAGLMQFKAGGDAYGVTERLQGVTEWQPAYAGRVVLWEAKDGRLVVADGHQRTGLARRIGEQQGRDIPLDATILREADGWTAGDARVEAAGKNIAEGTGTAIDAAKVIREAGRDRVLAMVPPRSPLVREADALSRLSDDAFGAVVNDVIRPEHAAIIGRLLPDDPQAHGALVDLLAKTKPGSQVQAESIVRQGIAAGFVDGVQFDMFGEYDKLASLFVQRAKVLDRTLAKLREKRGAFRLAARKAELLEEGGNAIDRGASDAAAAESAQAIELIERLAHSEGPISDALNRAAREHAGGRRIGEVVDELVDELGDIDLARAQAVTEAMETARIDALETDAQAMTGADAPIDADTLSLFDAPEAPGPKAQLDSMEHDARQLLEASAEPAAPENTRGGGVFFHGARGEVGQFTEGYYNPANIYGGMDTFYTTDAVDIAAGYRRKRADGRIYQAAERVPVNFFDMEARRAPDQWLSVLGVRNRDDDFRAFALDQVESDQPNLREIMDAMRVYSREEGLTRDEVQELFDAIIYNLREEGFGGMTHVGGLKTGREAHTVRIYFDPSQQIELTDVTDQWFRRQAPDVDGKAPRADGDRQQPESAARPAGEGGSGPGAGDTAQALIPAETPLPVADTGTAAPIVLPDAAARELAQLDLSVRMALRDGEPMLQLDDGVEAVPLRAIMEEFDADAAAIEAARACM